MKPPADTVRRRPGRPLSFDRDAALRRALELFWRQGYDTTSLADLTTAMRITPPSLYAAFGSKEQLFLEAKKRYDATTERILGPILDDTPTARAAIGGFLVAAARAYTDPSAPAGCFVLSAASNYAPGSARVARVLRDRRTETEARLARRIARGKRADEIPRAVNPAELAAFYYTVLRGMSAQARDGASRRKLLAVAAAAMSAWPA
jgi:AcrR family transcriptional regulator